MLAGEKFDRAVVHHLMTCSFHLGYI
jgi:hypothetical protein